MAQIAPKVLVVGAGISGLAAAHRFLELSRDSARPVDLRVLESSSRAGGVIETRLRDGFLREGGPDSFLTEKPWALSLCRRLGLDEELIGTSPLRKSFVVWKGRMHATPEGFYMLAPSQILPFLTSSLFSWRGKARMVAEAFQPRPAYPETDESLGSFVRRRFGEEALVRMAQPMVAGVYGADPERLSLRATFPVFLDMEATHGSVIRGLRARRHSHAGSAQVASGPRYGLFASMKKGMETLVDALCARLPAGALRLNSSVREIARDDAGWRVVLESGEAVAADAVCVALPAPRASRVLSNLDPDLAQSLSELVYNSAITINFAYRREAIRHALNGFGFVVPAAEGRSILGCTFSSVKFGGRAPDGMVLLRAFVGGSLGGSLGALSDGRLVLLVRRDLEEILGITDTPLSVSISRHLESMPQYAVGHLSWKDKARQRALNWPFLALIGNAFGGIGLPDCIREAETAAEEMWRKISLTPGLR